MNGVISKDDTGWIVVPYSSSFEAYSGYDDTGLFVRKCGHIVTIVGIIAPTGTISGSSDYVHIIESPLPSEYRPIERVRNIQRGLASNIWMLRVNTDGYVDFSRYRNTNSYASVYQGAQLFVNITYMTAD